MRTSSSVWRLGSVSCGAAEGSSQWRRQETPRDLTCSPALNSTKSSCLPQGSRQTPSQAGSPTTSDQTCFITSICFITFIACLSCDGEPKSLSVSNPTAILNSTQNCQWWHRWNYWGHLCVSLGSGQDSATEPEDWSQWRENV